MIEGVHEQFKVTKLGICAESSHVHEAQRRLYELLKLVVPYMVDGTRMQSMHIQAEMVSPYTFLIAHSEPDPDQICHCPSRFMRLQLQ